MRLLPLLQSSSVLPELPLGKGCGGAQKGSRIGADHGEKLSTPAWADLTPPHPHQPDTNSAGASLEKDPVKGLYLGQLHIFEQIFQCGSTLGIRYLLKKSKRKWSSSIS